MASHHSCRGVCRLRQHGDGCGGWRGGGIGVGVFVEVTTMLRDIVLAMVRERLERMPVTLVNDAVMVRNGAAITQEIGHG